MPWLRQQLRRMQVKAGQSIQTQTKEVEKLKMLLRGLEVGTMCAKSVFTFYVRVCNKGGGDANHVYM